VKIEVEIVGRRSVVVIATIVTKLNHNAIPCVVELEMEIQFVKGLLMQYFNICN
jgi:hypothetical protein